MIYLALLESHPTTNILAIIVCTLLTFIPIYYVYPSRTLVLKKLTLWLSLPWIILLTWAVIISGPGSMEAYSYPVTLISLFYIIYYLILSLYLTFRRNRLENRFPVKPL